MHYDFHEIISCASLRPFKVYFRQVSYSFFLWYFEISTLREKHRSRRWRLLGGRRELSQTKLLFLDFAAAAGSPKEFWAGAQSGNYRHIEREREERYKEREGEREEDGKTGESSGRAVGFRVFALPTQLYPGPSANPSVYVCQGRVCRWQGEGAGVPRQESSWHWA